MRLQFEPLGFGRARAGASALGGNPNQWKDERQKTLVLARLMNAGIDVDGDTPPARCWELLSDLLLSEIKR